MSAAIDMKHIGRNLVFAVVMGTISVLLAMLIVSGGIITAGLFVGLPIGIIFTAICLTNPRWGILVYINISFFVIGLNRFLSPNVPYGTSIDVVLTLCLIGTLLRTKKQDAMRLVNPVFYLVVVWFIYTLLELQNPEVVSTEAWFYAVRGVSIYWLQTLAVVLIWFYRKEDMDTFIRIWLIWSFIAALWGFKQQYIGLTLGEKIWLNDFGRQTHILNGKLRSFSFYTDAGQFGAAMAHACLFCLIMVFGAKNLQRKLFYLVLMGIYFWGYAVSGSRGPLFVLAGGLVGYIFLIKNIRLLIISIILMVSGFSFLKFTTIGQGNYQIQRLRSALDPEDASLLVRLENQRKLAAYLINKPMGGGLGSGGGWGQRFTPGTFLAETALDSWYVKIWVENGVVGLVLHVVVILVIIFIGFRKVYFLTDPEIRAKCVGLFCGFVGVAVASYGNQIFGQFPTSTIIYLSMVFFTRGDKMEEETAQLREAEAEQDPKGLKVW